MLTMVVVALCEIKYYQNKVVDRTFMPPYTFQKLVKQISNQYDIVFGDSVLINYRWEKHTIFKLQAMTEDVLTMIFEMMYSTPVNLTNQ